MALMPFYWSFDEVSLPAAGWFGQVRVFLTLSCLS